MVIVYHRATFNIKLGIGGHVLDFSSRLSSENPDRKIRTTDRTKKIQTEKSVPRNLSRLVRIFGPVRASKFNRIDPFRLNIELFLR